MKLFIQDAKWGKTTVLRQSSQYSGITYNAGWSCFDAPDYDYVICSDASTLPPQVQAIEKKRRVFVMHENPSIWKPSSELLEHFGVIISPFDCTENSSLVKIKAHSGVPWFYGITFDTDKGLLHVPKERSMCLDQIYKDALTPKTKLLSMIVSGKKILAGHKWRIEIAEKLKNRLGDNIDIYGFGHRPLHDKRTALIDYRFSVVIENSQSEYYWTEKLSDCLLGNCIPIYSGAHRAGEDLSYDMPRINFGSDTDQAVDEIVKIIERCNISNLTIQEAKNNILFRHNMLTWIPEQLKYSL